jgi:hypothetical protein
LRACIDDLLDDGEQVKGRARQSVNPRHRHHVAGAEGLQHPKKLAPVGPRTCHLLAVDVPAAASGGAQLLKLNIERLPVSADAGIAERAVLRFCFGHILRKP